MDNTIHQDEQMFTRVTNTLQNGLTGACVCVWMRDSNIVWHEENQIVLHSYVGTVENWIEMNICGHGAMSISGSFNH